MKDKKLSPLEKSLRTGWPDQFQISNMRSGKTPISRKMLILLYLASGGGMSLDMSYDGDYDSEYLRIMDDNSFAYDEEDADFEIMKANLDAMLSDCGFQTLDPRTPFDWIVLFGMATGDLFDIDDRLEGFLSELFGNEFQE